MSNEAVQKPNNIKKLPPTQPKKVASSKPSSPFNKSIYKSYEENKLAKPLSLEKTTSPTTATEKTLLNSTPSKFKPETDDPPSSLSKNALPKQKQPTLPSGIKDVTKSAKVVQKEMGDYGSPMTEQQASFVKSKKEFEAKPTTTKKSDSVSSKKLIGKDILKHDQKALPTGVKKEGTRNTELLTREKSNNLPEKQRPVSDMPTFMAKKSVSNEIKELPAGDAVRKGPILGAPIANQIIIDGTSSGAAPNLSSASVKIPQQTSEQTLIRLQPQTSGNVILQRNEKYDVTAAIKQVPSVANETAVITAPEALIKGVVESINIASDLDLTLDPYGEALKHRLVGQPLYFAQPSLTDQTHYDAYEPFSNEFVGRVPPPATKVEDGNPAAPLPGRSEASGLQPNTKSPQRSPWLYQFYNYPGYGNYPVQANASTQLPQESTLFGSPPPYPYSGQPQIFFPNNVHRSTPLATHFPQPVEETPKRVLSTLNPCPTCGINPISSTEYSRYCLPLDPSVATTKLSPRTLDRIPRDITKRSRNIYAGEGSLRASSPSVQYVRPRTFTPEFREPGIYGPEGCIGQTPWRRIERSLNRARSPETVPAEHDNAAYFYPPLAADLMADKANSEILSSGPPTPQSYDFGPKYRRYQEEPTKWKNEFAHETHRQKYFDKRYLEQSKYSRENQKYVSAKGLRGRKHFQGGLTTYRRSPYRSLSELATYYTQLEIEDQSDVISLLLSCRKLEKQIEEQNVVIDMLDHDLRQAQETLKFPPEWQEFKNLDLSGIPPTDMSKIPQGQLPLYIKGRVLLQQREPPPGATYILEPDMARAISVTTPTKEHSQTSEKLLNLDMPKAVSKKGLSGTEKGGSALQGKRTGTVLIKPGHTPPKESASKTKPGIAAPKDVAEAQKPLDKKSKPVPAPSNVVASKMTPSSVKVEKLGDTSIKAEPLKEDTRSLKTGTPLKAPLSTSSQSKSDSKAIMTPKSNPIAAKPDTLGEAKPLPGKNGLPVLKAKQLSQSEVTVETKDDGRTPLEVAVSSADTKAKPSALTTSKDTSKDISKDTSKDISKDTSKDISKDTSKDISTTQKKILPAPKPKDTVVPK